MGIRYIVVGAVVPLALAVSGCSGTDVAERIANDALEDQGVRVELEDDQVTVDGPDGAITAGSDLPEGFPADFPIPEGAQVQGGVSGVPGGQAEIVASILLPDGVEASAAYMEQALPEAGYEVTEATGSGTTRVIEISGNGLTGTVALNPQGDGTLMAVALAPLE